MNSNSNYAVKVVIFDLDDTLYSEKDYVRSGFHVVSDLLHEVNDIERKLWDAFERGMPAIDTVLKEEKIYSNEIKNACIAAYRHHKPSIHLYNGCETMLRHLRNSGIRTGIITDGRPEGQRAKIDSLGLQGLVDEIIITDELGGVEFRKPNSLAFEMMKEKLRVYYSDMVYIGDNPRKDFIAPIRLGMRACWFHNPDGLYNSEAQLRRDIMKINSFTELLKVCNEILISGSR